MHRNNSIDLMRLIAAVFVLLCHAPFAGTFGAVTVQLGRFAVPFFLMVSGYYVTPQSAPKQHRAILKLTGEMLLLYFILNSLLCIRNGRGALEWFTDMMTVKTLILFLAFNRLSFFANVAYYLFVMLYLYTIYRGAVHFGWLKYTRWVVFPLMAAGIGLCMLGKPWFYTGNWLMLGIPFFFLGQWLRQAPIQGKYAVPLLVCGVMLCIVEGLNGDYFLSVGSTMLCIGLFLLCQQHPAMTDDRTARLCRQYSQVIFIVHCGVRDCLRLFVTGNCWYFPLAVLAVCLLIAAAWAALRWIIALFGKPISV